MNAWSLKYFGLHSLNSFVVCSVFIGCAAVGPPIAPEDVGIEAKVRKQQQENIQIKEAISKKDTISVEEEGVELPVFYPIGTR